MQQASFLTCISAGFLSLAAKIALIPEKDQSDGLATFSLAGICSSPNSQLHSDFWSVSEPEGGKWNSLGPDTSMPQGVSGLTSK